jgi:hypothetical protein
MLRVDKFLPPGVFLWLDILQFELARLRFGCWFRFHAGGSSFGLLFPGLARTTPNAVRRPPFTSRLLDPSQK